MRGEANRLKGFWDGGKPPSRGIVFIEQIPEHEISQSHLQSITLRLVGMGMGMGIGEVEKRDAMRWIFSLYSPLCHFIRRIDSQQFCFD